MTPEQLVAAFIVCGSLMSAAVSIVTVVVLLHTLMDEADATDRRRLGYRLDAGRNGFDAARSEDPDRAESLRVYRETGWMTANETRRYGR